MADSPGARAARERLLLIDGHALVYRAFYALQNERPLTSPRGELTSGVYGFTSMLLKALGELKPRYIAASFDTSAPTFRHDASASYKATRVATPPGLSSQVRLSQQVLDAMQVPIHRLEGFEADDLIGTLSRQATDAGVDVIILTGDNDLLQLIGPHVSVLASRRGISDTVLYDRDGVFQKWGVEPSQVADFKGLRGDTSDNIPGVPGIGDKTAQKLLQQFGTIEALFERLAELPEKQRATLAPYREQVTAAKRLATIDCDAPVTLDLEATRLGDLHRAEVLGIFHELGFKSLVDRIPRSAAESPGETAVQAVLDLGQVKPAGPTLPVWEVTDEAGLALLVKKATAHGSVAFNVQATGTLPMSADVVGVGLAAGVPTTGDDNAFAAYVPVGHGAGTQLPAPVVFAALKGLFEDPRIKKRAHHAKFHLILLSRQGIEVEGLDFDTMIAAYLLESGQRALALRDLAWTKLQVELPSVVSLLGTGKKAVTMAQLGISECAAYAAQEAALVERLTPILQRELAEADQEPLFRNIELPLVPVLAEMERVGIGVDLPYLGTLQKELTARLAELEAEIYGSVGHQFNINSTQQLSTVLFDELQLQTGTRRSKTKSGHQSTGVEILEQLRNTHPVVGHILEHRQLQKLKSTYVDALQLLVQSGSGRVHTSFHQTVAATGRLSSSDPNLQNIPIRTEVGKRVRQVFVARPGAKLLSADYSQIELRVLAHMANDPTLLEAFARGEDPHAATAAEVLGLEIEDVTADQRRLAKMVNYGVLYGMSEFGLADRTDLPPAQAAQFIQRYFERFSTVKAFQDRVIHATESLGYSETMLGRRRYIPEVRSPIYAVRQAAVRAAINAPIQGTASDIVKIAMIRVAACLHEHAPEVAMLLQVHDELLLEGPEAELVKIAPEIGALMEGALELQVPLHVDFKLGPNWQDLAPLAVEVKHPVAAPARA